MPFLLLRPDEFTRRDKIVTYRDTGSHGSRRLDSQLRRLISSSDHTSSGAVAAYDHRRRSHNDYQVSVSQSYNHRPVTYSSYGYPTANNYATYQPYTYYPYAMVSADSYPQCPTCGKQFFRTTRRDEHRYRHGH